MVRSPASSFVPTSGPPKRPPNDCPALRHTCCASLYGIARHGFRQGKSFVSAPRTDKNESRCVDHGDAMIGQQTKVEISGLELLALKKIALIVRALEKSLTAHSSKTETRALLNVLMEVIGRAEVGG